MNHRILVRADDLGYSRGVNYGIADSVVRGIIRSVGVMPNMPETEMGLELLKGVDVCYGQHTNICVGRPLTDPALVPSICQPNGELKPSRAYREAAARGEDFVVLDEVVLEIEAQYRRFVELVGDEPHYFEGHAVASRNLFRGLEIVAERHGLPYLGLADRLGEAVSFRHSKLYTLIESMGPQSRESNYDPFETLKKGALTDYGEDGYCMLILHPGYLDDFILSKSSLTTPRVKEVAMSMAPETRAWLEENDVEVITYDDLA